MRYFVAGEGAPVVLVHGWTGAAANWVELAPLLARRHRVLVPDLPGHGGSTPLPAVPGFDPFADRVRLVMEREGMLPGVVVGHSLGGLVAMRLALRHPNDVRALVLAASAGIESVTRRSAFWIAVIAITRPGKAVAPLRALLGRRPALRPPVFGRYEVADPRSLSPEAIEGLLCSARLHTDVRSPAWALIRDDPRLDLERVACPSLVLWGARDLQVPIGDAFEYARRLRAPLRTLADTGHLLMVERPAACAEAIEEFLDGIGEVDELPREAEALG
jgi:pimeloyl-ACP methyl ester carboxylesterase